MSFLFIIAIIFLLYFRKNQKNLIDDICSRHDYLRVHTSEYADLERQKKWQNQYRHPWIIWESIGIHIVSCYVIYLIWGFWASLLFSVSPFSVSVVSWKTGCYLYGSANLLTLITYYFLIQPGWPSFTAPIWYFTAVNLSVSPLLFPLFATICYPSIQSCMLWVPWAMFLFGKRFRHGLSQRGTSHKEINFNPEGKLYWKRILIPHRTIGWVICKFIWPSRLGFFNDCQAHCNYYTLDRHFFLFAVVDIVTFIWMWLVDPVMCVWFFTALLVHGGALVFSQFQSERYQTIANAAFCVILAKTLAPWPVALAVLSTLYFCRSWLYVKAHRNNLTLFQESATNYPTVPENLNNAGNAWACAVPPNMHNAYANWLAARNYGYVNSYILVNLTQALCDLGQFNHAKIHALEALKCNPPEKERAGIQELITFIDKQIEKMQRNHKILRQVFRNQ